MKFIYIIWLAAILFAGNLIAADIKGAKDHPLITRYPGSEIQWYEVNNYRPYKIPIGPVTGYRSIDKWIETEGRVTRIYYALAGGKRTYNEVYKNYQEALKGADFEILAEGLVNATARGGMIGGRPWQEVLYGANPFAHDGAVSAMGRGSATAGGRGSIVAQKMRAAGMVYVVVSVYKFSDAVISTLVDVIEVEKAETGLIAVNAEAIGADITEKGRVILDGIFFDFDKATLKAESRAALLQITAFLKANPGKRFYVVGHTDSRGELSYNQNLSLARARAVVETLVKDYSIASNRLEPHGAGPLTPVFSNNSDAGRERNRRVELVER